MIADCYLAVGEREKGEKLLRDLFKAKKEEIDYLYSQKQLKNRLEQSIRVTVSDIYLVGQIAQSRQLTDLLYEVSDVLSQFYVRE
jgi:hypothetical protein